MKKKKINKNSTVYKQAQILKKYNINPENLDPTKIKQFKEMCKSINDSRVKGKITYKIWDIVIVAFLAILGKADTWEEIEAFAKSKYPWLKSFLQLTGGIPTSSTYERVIGIIDSKQLENICLLFINNSIKVFSSKIDIVSFDGKVAKSSGQNKTDLKEEIKQLNSLNVYSKNRGICIASEMIADKTNEIPTIPKVIKRISLKDSISTWDALNTQKDNVEAVINAGGNYVVALKGNQGNFFNDVTLYFDDKKLDIIRSGHSGAYLTYNEKSHSSIIKYEYFQTEDIKWYSDYKSWCGLKSIGLVVKTIIKNDNINIEKRYYISSLLNNIILFADSIRAHWQVENNLHWQLDYTFKEDDNTTLNKNALFNLGIMKKLALALLNKAKPIYNCSLNMVRYRLSLDYETEVLRLFNIIANN